MPAHASSDVRAPSARTAGWPRLRARPPARARRTLRGARSRTRWRSGPWNRRSTRPTRRHPPGRERFEHEVVAAQLGERSADPRDGRRRSALRPDTKVQRQAAGGDVHEQPARRARRASASRRRGRRRATVAIPWAPARTVSFRTAWPQCRRTSMRRCGWARRRMTTVRCLAAPTRAATARMAAAARLRATRSGRSGAVACGAARGRIRHRPARCRPIPPAPPRPVTSQASRAALPARSASLSTRWCAPAARRAPATPCTTPSTCQTCSTGLPSSSSSTEAGSTPEPPSLTATATVSTSPAASTAPSAGCGAPNAGAVVSGTSKCALPSVRLPAASEHVPGQRVGAVGQRGRRAAGGSAARSTSSATAVPSSCSADHGARRSWHRRRPARCGQRVGRGGARRHETRNGRRPVDADGERQRRPPVPRSHPRR